MVFARDQLATLSRNKLGESSARTSFINVMGSATLTIPLISFEVLVASMGRGYMPAFGWTIFTMVLANITAVMGWGDWFPWAVPLMFSGAAGSQSSQLELHSYMVVILTDIIGLVSTYYRWRNADQTN